MTFFNLCDTFNNELICYSFMELIENLILSCHFCRSDTGAWAHARMPNQAIQHSQENQKYKGKGEGDA